MGLLCLKWVLFLKRNQNWELGEIGKKEKGSFLNCIAEMKEQLMLSPSLSLSLSLSLLPE